MPARRGCDVRSLAKSFGPRSPRPHAAADDDVAAPPLAPRGRQRPLGPPLRRTFALVPAAAGYSCSGERGSADRRPPRRRTARRRSPRGSPGARRLRRARGVLRPRPPRPSEPRHPQASLPRPRARSLRLRQARVVLERDIPLGAGRSFPRRAPACLFLSLHSRRAKTPRFHADDGGAFVLFLQKRREPRSHGHLWALPHVREQVFLDRGAQ